MKTRPYLNFVLTVIAINLTVLTLKQLDIIPTAHAAPHYNNSTVGAATDVNIVSVNGQSIFGGNLPMVLKDVETKEKLMVEVQGWKTYDVPSIEIKRISTSDKMPVEVKNSYVYVKNY